MTFRRVIHAALGCGLLASAAACEGAQEKPATPPEPIFKPIDPAAAAAALSGAGVERYVGTLPCADCSGIRTELALIPSPSPGQPPAYQLVETYVGSMSNDGEKVTTSRGTWTTTTGVPGDPLAPVVRLDGGGAPDNARAFERLSSQELRLLDRAGARIASTANYSLTRVADTPITLPAATPTAGPAGAPASAADGGPVAMVTDLASGWPVSLRVGQPMTARLTADRAAGGRWTLRAGSDAGIVVGEGEPAFETAGAGTVQVFRLKAVKAGTATVTFDYRVGDATTPARSVSYPVTVQ